MGLDGWPNCIFGAEPASRRVATECERGGEAAGDDGDGGPSGDCATPGGSGGGGVWQTASATAC